MKLLVLIIPKGFESKVEHTISKVGLFFQTTVLGQGTAPSELLEYLSMGDKEKEIMLIFIDNQDTEKIFFELDKEYQFKSTNFGVAFTLDTNSITNATYEYLQQFKMEDQYMNIEQALIVFICNHGYAYDAMAEARKVGARGGTIIHGRSSLSNEKQKFMGITIHPEKDIILLVCLEEQKTKLMEAMSAKFGVSSEAKGLIFSLKIDDSIGFVFDPLPPLTK